MQTFMLLVVWVRLLLEVSASSCDDDNHQCLLARRVHCNRNGEKCDDDDIVKENHHPCCSGYVCGSNGTCEPTSPPPPPLCECRPTSTTIAGNSTDLTEEGNNNNYELDATLTRRDGSLTIVLDNLANFVVNRAYTIWFGTYDSVAYNSNTTSFEFDETTGDRQLYNLGGFVFESSMEPLRFLVAQADRRRGQGQGGDCPLTEAAEAYPSGCADDDACDDIPLDGTCVKYDPADDCAIILPRNCETFEICSDNDLGDRGTGLRDAQNDIITLWIKDHGPYDFATYGNTQLETFNGGCTQPTVYVPKDTCPMDNDSGFNCTDIMKIEF